MNTNKLTAEESKRVAMALDDVEYMLNYKLNIDAFNSLEARYKLIDNLEAMVMVYAACSFVIREVMGEAQQLRLFPWKQFTQARRRDIIDNLLDFVKELEA